MASIQYLNNLLPSAKFAIKGKNLPKAFVIDAANQSEAELWVFGTPMFCGAAGPLFSSNTRPAQE